MAERKDDGGPAFPVEVSTRFDTTAGMSLRDYFAGQAVSSASARSWQGWSQHSIEAFARTAYAIADAMLAERQK